MFDCEIYETEYAEALAFADYAEEEDFVDDCDECGFDPYEGCYTWDC